ncbi:MAG: hypothetical protein KI786_01370 [Mameliella sp.]|nr:hypothetical protein [Phaeodactylibacter sp.]
MYKFTSKTLPIALMIMASSTIAFGQVEGVDTTSAGYQIGYKIGSWLPFVIIFVLALMVIIRTYRLSQKNGPK